MIGIIGAMEEEVAILKHKLVNLNEIEVACKILSWATK